MTVIADRPDVLFRRDDLIVEWSRALNGERLQCEEELLSVGYSLPLEHRTAWARYRSPAESWFMPIRRADGALAAGFAVEVGLSRSLPGHVVLRAARFGQAWPADVREAGVAALEAMALRDPRVLRLHVELFVTNPEARAELERDLFARGFRAVADPRRYPQTVAIDLRPSEEDILASFSGTARRHIRAVRKHPVSIRAIDDVKWASRMNDIYVETMQRTDGGSRRREWNRCIGFANEHPELSRLVGLYRTDACGADSLLSFAWGCLHGDYVHYDAAASTRQTDLRMPLGYALVWDLCVWAKQRGATWFDFGGITAGHHGSDDRLGGISDFKRGFSSNVVSLGGEWVLEPRPLRARMARAVSSSAAWWTRNRPRLAARR